MYQGHQHGMALAERRPAKPLALLTGLGLVTSPELGLAGAGMRKMLL